MLDLDQPSNIPYAYNVTFANHKAYLDDHLVPLDDTKDDESPLAFVMHFGLVFDCIVDVGCGTQFVVCYNLCLYDIVLEVH